MKETPQERINRKVEAYRLKLQAAEAERQKKIQLQIQAAIKKSNAAYNKASPAQRRVMIAKDVIVRLNNGQLYAATGSFVDPSGPSEVTGNANLQEIIHNPLFEKGFHYENGTSPVCYVCGIGGLFVSAVAFRNECQLNGTGLLPSRFMPLKELKEFSIEQRQLIELAFESGTGYYSFASSARKERQVKVTKLTRAAANWRSKYFRYFRHEMSSKPVLIAIAKNIIKHKGKFNPLVK